MGTVRVERCPDCQALVGEGLMPTHRAYCDVRPARKLTQQDKFVRDTLREFEETCREHGVLVSEWQRYYQFLQLALQRALEQQDA
jgi:hypothetical protein